VLCEALRVREWTETEFAWALGYSTLFVKALLREPHFTPELALRLEAAGLGRAEDWMTVQRDYDLGELRERMGGEMAMIQRRAIRIQLVRDN
jgi:plasmid maintenance system antidote protein VapI